MNTIGQSDNSSNFISMQQSFVTNNATNLTSHLPSTTLSVPNCSTVTVTLTLGVLWLVQSTSIRHLSCCFRTCFVPEWHVPSLPLLQLKVNQLHHNMDSHIQTAKVCIPMCCGFSLYVHSFAFHWATPYTAFIDPQLWGQPGLATLGWIWVQSHSVVIITLYGRARMLRKCSKWRTEFGRLFFSLLTLLWVHWRRKAFQQALLSRNTEFIE